ncbi:alkyl/aryl-sulfatase [Roseateles puraquae]|uniref:Alkyl/aryl-sulfatase n=1 Tax=Roseateles puraquae TaxID=431059 RepID=A0A254N4R2_9BURK|nr:alkyl sulfatase dimerization domain-containing protein [Roseateles puraquae]MDG0857551.1 MBL fold metallo-hydrolase [Roseateles puraquae]OWR03049.1 alkyl/aryl-sulfatase [Roseateles puraquae]
MKTWLAALAALTLAGCNRPAELPAATGDVTPTTLQAQAAVAQALPLAEQQAFDDAARGLIARPDGQILAEDGRVLMDFDAYRFVQGEAPPTVNPSLWRQAKLNAQIGLFKVVEGVWQLRGFDIGNMTLVQGRSGWIVIDALTCRETAAAAIAFARKHLGNQPVTALLYTHSHVDHFGGALGLLTPEQARQVPVIASAGFMEEATSENLMVGTAMARRSIYQFGKNLPATVQGRVDTGLGKGVGYGRVGLLAPNDLITQPTEERTLDGVRFIFHNVPGAEAPAEMTFSIPALKVYGGAENLAQTLHNLLPVRGAKVRDALRWAGYLQDALDQLGDAEVYVGQHNWPVWGRERIVDFITRQRDAYKYLHDQTVRLINAGLTPAEIAEQVKLPASLQTFFPTRGYYGDVRHNVKAIYQFYLGAYDGNPAHLNPLPPEVMGRRYVTLAGGADKLMAAAQQAFDEGDYRWAAELLNRLVMADSRHTGARQLLARTYDQLGYAAEAATWRNSYLSAAAELRQGPPQQGIDRSVALDMLQQTPTERFLEAMAAGLNGPAAEGKDYRINLVFTDRPESHVLWIENAVLHHRRASPAADAHATMKLTHAFFIRMMAGKVGAKDLLMSDEIQISGSRIDLARFLGLIDKAPGTFPIVTR